MKPKSGCTGSLLYQKSTVLLSQILLLFLFASPFVTKAQFYKPSEKTIRLDETLPEAFYQTIHQAVYAKTGQPATLRLVDYRNKLIILDFWASWCSPCIRSLHTLDSLQRKFKDSLQVIAVTYESSDIACQALKKAGLVLPSVTGDTLLKKNFPHHVVPHQVWISNGKVLAVTAHTEATAANIEKVLAGKPAALHQKRDLLSYSRTEPISRYAVERGSAILCTTILTSEIEGLSSGLSNARKDSMRITSFNNLPVLSMYQAALGIPYCLIEVSPSLVQSSNFCYQVVLPLNIPKEKATQKIVTGLNNSFDLNGRYESRAVNCFAICKRKRRPSAQQGITPAAQAPDETMRELKISAFTDLLNASVSWSPVLPVFIDETGGKDQVRVPFPLEPLKAPDTLRRFLGQQGYRLKAVKRKLKVFVIAPH